MDDTTIQDLKKINELVESLLTKLGATDEEDDAPEQDDSNDQDLADNSQDSDDRDSRKLALLATLKKRNEKLP